MTPAAIFADFDTPEKRAALVRAYLEKTEPMTKINTLRDAMRWGDEWHAEAQRLELLLLCAKANELASDALLRMAEDELARARGV